MVRAWVLLCLVVFGGVISGCATIPGRVDLGLVPRCEVSAEGDLTLRGSTNAAMLACVQRHTPLSARRVILNSQGGDVASALSIAELLQPLQADMIVRRNCHSSCANYFLPVARRIVVEPGASVILHGSIDGHMMARMEALAAEKGVTFDFRALHDRQMAFAARNDISLGWLSYRTDVEFRAGSDGRHLTGAAETWKAEDPREANIAYIVVEEAMMRNCLGNVEIAAFEDTRVQRAYTDRRLRTRWARQDTYPSGTLACVDDSFVSPD